MTERKGTTTREAVFRTVKRFAWIPVRSTYGDWIFLARYESVERLEPDYGGWSTGHYLVLERRQVEAADAQLLPTGRSAMTLQSFSNNNFDLIRLAAAMQVAVCHTIESMAPQWSAAPAVRLLELFPGVPIFFFISGFLISRSYENNPRLADYARNRALRIFPALHACVLLNIVLVALTGYFSLVDVGIGDLGILYAAKSTFFQFYNPPYMRHFGDGVLNGSLWTVCVELQFYFLIPIVYRFLVARKRWQNDLVIITLIVMSIVINRLLWASRPEFADSNYWKLLRVSFLPWAYMFLFGVLSQRHFQDLRRWFVPYAFPVGTTLYLGYAIAMRHHGASFNNDISPWLYFPVAVLTLAGAYSMPTLSSALLHKNDISYGVYIYHMPIVDLMLYTGYTGELKFALLAVAAAVSLAALSWFMIERPALARKHRPLQPIAERDVGSSYLRPDGISV